MTNSADAADSARGWHWRGVRRPDFAAAPKAGQESVWDYPRPPICQVDQREVVVRWGSREVARTCRAIRVLETAHPPSFYLPWDDVARDLLVPGSGSSFCEWKGKAQYWSLVDGARRLVNVAWSYPAPDPRFASIKDTIALYPSSLQMHRGWRSGDRTTGRFLRRLDNLGIDWSVQG